MAADYVAVFERLHVKSGEQRQAASSGGTVKIAERG
jgi:hypothetical protein